MRFIRRINRRYWRIQHQFLEWFQGCTLYLNAITQSVLSYFYKNILFSPLIQNILNYPRYTLSYSNMGLKLVDLWRSDLGRYKFQLPIYLIIILFTSYWIALRAGSWLILFVVFIAFVYQNLSYSWIRDYPKYNRYHFFENAKKRRIRRQKFLINTALRRKFILRNKSGYFFRKEVLLKRNWSLNKTVFQEYVFNKNNIHVNYKIFNQDMFINHHISYYHTAICIDPKSETLYEQEFLKNYILSRKNMLQEIEYILKAQNIINGTGTLVFKKLYAKYLVYDHISNSKVLLSCLAICWQTNNNICEPIMALGPWCFEEIKKKPWYVVLENDVYKEAFLAGQPIGIYEYEKKVVVEKPSLIEDLRELLTKIYEIDRKTFLKSYYVWTHFLSLMIGGIIAFYDDIKYWYAINIFKWSWKWRKRQIRKLFKPYKRRQLKKHFIYFLKTIIINPLHILIQFLSLIFDITGARWLRWNDAWYNNFMEKLMEPFNQRSRTIGRWYRFTPKSIIYNERLGLHIENFVLFLLIKFPYPVYEIRIYPWLQNNLKKFPILIAKELKRVIPLIFDFLKTQIKYLFNTLYSLKTKKFEINQNTLVKVKGKKKFSVITFNKNLSKDKTNYIVNKITYWRNDYIRWQLRSMKINQQFYFYDYLHYDENRSFADYFVTQKHEEQLWSIEVKDNTEDTIADDCTSLATIREMSYRIWDQPWWEDEHMPDELFELHVSIAIIDLFVIQLGSLNYINDSLSESDSKLLFALSKQLEVSIISYLPATNIYEILIHWNYTKNLTNFSPACTNNVIGGKNLFNETISDVFALDQLHTLLFGEKKIDIDNYTFVEACYEELIYYHNYSQLTGFSQMYFDITTSFSKDYENIRTKSEQNLNVLNNICSSLTSNDIIWTNTVVKIILVELKSVISVLELIIKDSCNKIFNNFNRDKSNKAKIIIKTKKSNKFSKYKFKFKVIKVFNIYVQNITSKNVLLASFNDLE